MDSVYRSSSVIPQLGLYLFLAAITVLWGSSSCHAQYASVPHASTPTPATKQIQLDLVVVRMRHENYLQLMKFVVDNKSTRPSPTPPFFGVCKSTRALEAVEELLRENGSLKVVAEPRLVTIAGKPASFELGTVSKESQKNESQSDASGFRIEAIPTLLNGNKVRLEFHRELTEFTRVSHPGKVNTPPIPKTDRLVTTAILKQGQTLIVNGCTHHTISATVTSVPFLGQLPLLGSYFQTKKYNQIEVDTVVFATPYIIFDAANETSAANSGARALRSSETKRIELLERRVKKLTQEIEKMRKND